MNISVFQNLLLIGHPNTGKSSLFSQLSGKRAEIGNRPGVTVERCLAPLKSDPSRYVEDLPGIYYLDTQNFGCAAYQAVTLHRLSELKHSDLIVNVYNIIVCKDFITKKSITMTRMNYRFRINQ